MWAAIQQLPTLGGLSIDFRAGVSLEAEAPPPGGIALSRAVLSLNPWTHDDD